MKVEVFQRTIPGGIRRRFEQGKVAANKWANYSINLQEIKL